ncbi:MAG: primase C-terminal domain-containing protein [Schwartzia sp.]|nr:primase C-terminal domain-containing protein [Schwartzia sp. (in: firmicutes)]
MRMTIYTADCRGREANSVYPNRRVVTNADELKAAVANDHVCAKFRNNHRGKDDFLESDVEVMDCDNGHSENPDDWIAPESMETLFEGVCYAIAPSRNNGKKKGGKAARPRFHIYFPHGKIADAEKCRELKANIQREFPIFDQGAMDAARFIYGNPVDDVVWHEGDVTIDFWFARRTIPEGKRNNTLSRFAGRVLKRYGIGDKARSIFDEEAAKCDPPLPDEELDKIWKSACRFAKKVQQEKGYIAPEEYGKSLKPADYSDVGQARVLAREYADELRFTTATDYLRYNGKYWEESRELAVGAAEEFLDLQLADAKDAVEKAFQALCAAGLTEATVSAGGKTLEKQIGADQREAYLSYISAVAYKAFVMKRRDMKFITSALSAAKPLLLAKPSDLDKDAFLLNCQDGTYDLNTAGRRDFSPSDIITKICNAAPGDEGRELWERFLSTIFLGDAELIEYVQKICGLGAIGKVYMEAVIISYGEGANGKSTFWNTIAWALGTYAGGISADALTVGCRRNVKPEIAEVKGKRLLIAAELEEGMRLSTATVKQLCSTDQIKGEKKYKDPFDFVPSHTLVLYTNHLPKVGAMDRGIWRRLIVIPFNAVISGESDVKNYADYLQKNAGQYVLQWIIEGAAKVIKENFNPKLPKVVEDAIGRYRNDSNWLGYFVEECCDVGEEFVEKSGDFYNAYRAFCMRTGDYVRDSATFYSAVEQAGFRRFRKTNGRFVGGVRLKDEFAEA